jgi:hypothetical protein
MADAADDDFAKKLIGTHVLVGVTRVDHTGNVLAQEQFYGKVIRASVGEGVILMDAMGEERSLPLDQKAFKVAPPGEYRLRATGEVVVDPNWLSTWTVYPPAGR